MSSTFEIFIPLIIGKGIDHIIGVGQVDFETLGKYIGYLALSIVGFASFKWLLSRVANEMSYRIEQQMHDDIFKKFNKVPLKYIDSSSHGDLQSRMVNDVELLL